MQAVVAALPRITHTLLVSATLSTKVGGCMEELPGWQAPEPIPCCGPPVPHPCPPPPIACCQLDDLRRLVLHNPAILRLEDADGAGGGGGGTLSQYYVRVPAGDRFLLCVGDERRPAHLPLVPARPH